MLNSYININKKIDELLLIYKENYLNEKLKEIQNYIDKIINIIQVDSISIELNELLENLLREITSFLGICEEKKDVIDENDIKFSVKIIQELYKELEKNFERACQSDIMDINAEMKLLQRLLKEDGYLKDSNKRRKK